MADAVREQIVEFYDGYDEDRRLQRDIGPLELAHAQEVLRRCLPVAVCRPRG